MIDPNIALSARSAPQNDPLESYGRILTLRHLIAQQALLPGQIQHQQLQNQIAERGIAEDEAVKSALRGNPDLESALPQIMQASPKTGVAFQKNVLENRKTKAELAKLKIEHDLKATEFIGQQLAGVKDQSSYDAALAAMQSVDLPTDQMPAEYDPAHVQASIQKGLSIKDRLQQEHQKNLEGLREREVSATEAQRKETGRHNLAMEATGGVRATEQNRHNLQMEPAGQMSAMMNIMNGPVFGGPGSTPSNPGGIQIPAEAPGQPGRTQLAAKNNNPGNLMFAGQKGASQGEGGFAKFDTPQAGYDALVSQIKLDQSRPLTLAGYISKFAPPNENDTAGYLANAVKELGTPADTPLAKIDPLKIAAFQAKQESSSTVTPAAAVQPATAAPSQPGGRNEAALATVPPALAAEVRAVAEGRQALWPPGGRSSMGMMNEMKRQLLYKYDPGFDQTNSGARMATARDFAPSGKNGQSINAIGTALQHAGDLSDLVEGLNNTNFRKYNSIANWFQNEKGSPEVKRFENVRGKFAEELTRAWRGSGGAEADLQRELSVLNAADSPDQLRQVLNDDVKLLSAKYTESLHQYEGAMGIPLPDAKGISKEAKAAAQRIGGRTGGVAPIKLKDGRILTPHDQAAAEAFRKDHPELISNGR